MRGELNLRCWVAAGVEGGVLEVLLSPVADKIAENT